MRVGLAGRRRSAAAPRLLAADLDNNGALNLIGSQRSAGSVWLADEHRLKSVEPLTCRSTVKLFSVGSDLN